MANLRSFKVCWQPEIFLGICEICGKSVPFNNVFFQVINCGSVISRLSRSTWGWICSGKSVGMRRRRRVWRALAGGRNINYFGIDKSEEWGAYLKVELIPACDRAAYC